MNSTSEEMLSYAKEIKAAYPTIADEDLKKALSVKYIGGKDALPGASAGCCADPLGDYVALLSIVFNSIRKVITQDKQKLIEIQTKIDQVVHQLSCVR